MREDGSFWTDLGGGVGGSESQSGIRSPLLSIVQWCCTFVSGIRTPPA